MYVDLALLFLIYAFATIALGVSVYSLWTLKEIEEYYKKKNSKTKNTWNQQYTKVEQKPKNKSYWG